MVFYTRKPFLLLLLLAVHCVSSKREQKITVCVVTQWERSQSIVGRAEKEKPAEKWTMFILKIFCFPSIASNQFNFFFSRIFSTKCFGFHFCVGTHETAFIRQPADRNTVPPSKHSKSNHASNSKTTQKCSWLFSAESLPWKPFAYNFLMNLNVWKNWHRQQ